MNLEGPLEIFIATNTIALLAGSFEYILHSEFNSFFVLYFLTLIRNMGIALLLETVHCTKPFLTPGERRYDWLPYFLQTSAIDAGTKYITLLYPGNGYSIIWFVPACFAFEVLFDFLHYWSHRYAHMNRWLYVNTHRIHHEHPAIDSFSTFVQHPVDLFLTNVIPFGLTQWIIGFNTYQICLFSWYKAMIEIGGHVGRDTFASSFPLCIWMPRWFSIELYARDHNTHHVKPLKNFSKRFSLWDKVFGTFHDCRESKTD